MLFKSKPKAGVGAPFDKNRVVSDCDIESLYENVPEKVLTCDGQLTYYDRLIYYWAANVFYSGQGNIVDGGALVGGSTTIFGEGLTRNAKAAKRDGSIHVYDLFEDEVDGYSANLLRGWYKEEKKAGKSYDFEGHFRRNTAEYAKFLSVHKGDITKFGYKDKRPIEVLSIDVAKTPQLMSFVAREFFPKLLTSRSIILHQDYIFAFQPWLHIAMEMMSDLVEKVYDAPTNCTSVFVPVREISSKDVTDRLGSQDGAYFTISNVRYLYAAIEKAETHVGKILLTGSLAYFHILIGQRKTADLIARRLIDQYDVSAALVGRTELVTLFRNELNIDVAKIAG